jgi:hypothetical protein
MVAQLPEIEEVAGGAAGLTGSGDAAAITGVNCVARCEDVEDADGFGDGDGKFATAPPQAGQKRTSGTIGFPQCVQNWATVDSLQ